MKKRRGTFILISLVLVVMLNVFFLVKAEAASTSNDQPSDFTVETKSRNVYCQILGNRQGCRNDNSRTCNNTVFCR